MKSAWLLCCSAALVMLAGCSSSNGSTMPNSSSFARPAGGQNGKASLKCFAGYGGTCTITNNGAILDNRAPSSYAGVFITSTNKLANTPLSQLTALGFTYSGDDGNGNPVYPTAGSPRFSIPTNQPPSGGGSGSVYAFVYAQPCYGNNNITNGPASGTVDAINGNWCKEMNTYSSPYQYWQNWSDFSAYFSNAEIVGSHGPQGYPFIVVDSAPGVWTITNVQIAKIGD